MNFSTTREQGSLEITELTEEENSLTGKIIGAAIDVHRTLGPGLTEDRKSKSHTHILQRRYA